MNEFFFSNLLKKNANIKPKTNVYKDVVNVCLINISV